MSMICLSRIGLWVVLCLFAVPILEAGPEERTWADTAGRQLEGRMTGLDDEAVEVCLAGSRRTVRIRRTLLSAEDRAYVDRWDAMGFGIKVERWPRELRPMLNFTARAEAQQRPGEWVYATPNFEFRCDVELAPSLIKEYSLAFEGTFYALSELPLQLNPSPPEERFVVRLFKDRNDYLRAGGPQGSAGVYMLRSQEILVPMASLGVRDVGHRVAIDRRNFDAGTLIHEITHQVMHEWLNVMPVWFVEGLAEYMSAVPFDEARFRFHEIRGGIRGHLEREYGIEAAGGGNLVVDVLHPADLMEMKHAEWAVAVSSGQGAALNYQSALLFTFYLVHLQEEGDAAPLVAYLRTAREREEELESFVVHYNEAVNTYNAQLDAYNQAVSGYNRELVAFRREVDAFNERVRTFNSQLERGVAKSKLIVVEPEPGDPPVPPEKPEVPPILMENATGLDTIDLAEAEKAARLAIFRDAEPDALWEDMREKLGAMGIEIRVMRTAVQASQFPAIRATPIRKAR